MYSLVFAPAAKRQWEKLVRRISLADYDALEAAIELLASDPRMPKASKLVGEKDVYRLRLGDYRVIYHVSDSEALVLVTKVARRSERTYRRLN